MASPSSFLNSLSLAADSALERPCASYPWMVLSPILIEAIDPTSASTVVYLTEELASTVRAISQEEVKVFKPNGLNRNWHLDGSAVTTTGEFLIAVSRAGLA